MIESQTRYFIIDNPEQKNIKSFVKKHLDCIRIILYKMLFSGIHPRIEEKKYKVSVCAIFKNEAPYLKEWKEFHRIKG